MCVCACVYEYFVQRANLPKRKANTKNNDLLVAPFLNADDNRFDFGFNGETVKSTALLARHCMRMRSGLCFFFYENATGGGLGNTAALSAVF